MTAMADVFRTQLRFEGLRTMLWSAGMFAAGLAVVVLARTLAGMDSFTDLVGQVPHPIRSFLGIGAIGNPAGFLDTVFFGYVAPIAFITYGIGVGSRAATPPDEHAPHRPDLVSSTARSQGSMRARGSTFGRLRFVTVITSTLAVGAALIGFATMAGLQIGGSVTNVGLDEGRVFTAVAADVLLGVASGTVALVIGARTGRQAVAAWTATGIVIAADLVNSVAPAIHGFNGLRYLSLVYYAESGQPMGHGLNAGHLLVLLFIAAGLTMLASFAPRLRMPQ
jgi:ABC-2 type transport system permease protein